MANWNTNGPGDIEYQEKQRKAVELRKAGATYAYIAQQVGYADESGARKAVKTYLEGIQFETATDYRMLQIMELNDLRRGLIVAARQGNFGAIDRLLRIQEREAKLLGLDAPTTGLTLDVTKMSDEELEAAWARLARG